MKIKNILVPVDFSDCSKNALRYAISIAKKFDAKIHMVNAVHVHAPHADVLGTNLVETIVQEYEAQVKRSFDELEKEIIELNDVPHSADRFISYLIDAIHTETVNKDIDIIIMGTREQHDGVDHFLGTRSMDVIESAIVPVLVIPENWHKTSIEKIGFALQTEEFKNENRLKMLNSFAISNGASILAFTTARDVKEISARDQANFRDVVARFDDGIASFRTVESESILEGVKEFCEVQKLDILAMMPKHHSFFEKLFKKSITKSIALNINIPTLTFRE